MKQLIDCRHITLSKFKLERGYQPNHSLLFILSGEMEFTMQGAVSRAGAHTLVSFPDNVYFKRRILSPCAFYYIRYENPDRDPLPVGIVPIEQTGRLQSTVQYLLQLSGIPGQQALKDGFLSDIFHQIEAQTLLTHMQNDPVVAQVRGYFERHLHRKITLKETADIACLSVSGLIYHFKKHTGLTPMEYLIAMRLRRAEDLLCQSGESIARIAALCGFENPYYFSNTFKKHNGVSPTVYRQQHGI